MNITEIKSEIAGDSYYKVEHPSGLTIFVYPKEGYTSSYAIFGTRYGSINTKFSVNGGDIITVPDGIAHYLEHKLFESEEGDAFVRYAKQVQMQTHIQALKKPAIFSHVRTSLTKALKFFLILFRIPTLRLRQLQRNRALSVRKSKCTTTLPIGE